MFIITAMCVDYEYYTATYGDFKTYEDAEYSLQVAAERFARLCYEADLRDTKGTKTKIADYERPGCINKEQMQFGENDKTYYNFASNDNRIQLTISEAYQISDLPPYPLIPSLDYLDEPPKSLWQRLCKKIERRSCRRRTLAATETPKGEIASV